MGQLRTIATSYWTAVALGALAVFLHVRWYTVDKAAGGEVVSGFGAALVVLGVFVAARPFIKTGVDSTARAQVPALPFAFAAPDQEGMRPFLEHQEAAYRHFRREVIAERVVAVLVIVLGTLLNGYGPLVARCLGLRAG